MDMPICDVCLSSDILCSGCDQKVEAGKITATDISVARSIYSMREENTSLNESKLVRVLDSDILILVAGTGHGSKLVGKRGAVVKGLAKDFEKSIRVIEEGDFHEFISNLASPAPILGVNIAYRDGKKIFRVRIPELHKNKVMLSGDSFSSVIKQMYKKNIELVFE